MPARSKRVPADGTSHVSGDRDIPLWELTIPQLLKQTVARHGQREAVVFGQQNIRWTYQDFDRRVDEFAAGLLAAGISTGDRVGIWSPNRAEWVVTQFATARIGAILVNINPAYRVAELEYALNKVGCKALVLARAFKTSDYLGMLRSLAPELDSAAPGHLTAQRLPHLRVVIGMGYGYMPGLFRFGDVQSMGTASHRLKLDAVTAGLSLQDPINIQFTSGTTGTPKGATLTHRNIVNNARFVTGTMRLGEHDRLAIPVPLYHCFGMVMGVMGAVAQGATMVFPGEGFEAEGVLEAVARERCTALYGVPTMFVAMLEHARFAEFDLTSLRTGVMAGAPCPIEVMKRVVSDMSMSQVTIAYGMTETSPVSFQSNVDDPIDRRVSTVGRVHPHVEVKLVDEAGATVPVGIAGELCTRGYSVMRGYWGEEELTKQSVDPAGWMHTGDLATIDAEGFCNIVGRVKDMLIRGGENVYPREVEEFLYRNPKVEQVQVFGVPDEKYGEEICAWIVLKAGQTATEDEVRAFCRDQIAHYKVPRHVRFVAELPMTVTGKAQKFKMRETMMAELGLT
ncbi:AMP-binding protein [Mesorhizobium sp. INR15]|uniref:AMP-binding protein n=1 Tax=Mesorhizobium sp. INR15 TaxID=2654248 RepID=UPI0018968737|nr:AMP-binding protein [Mesorhizobium sp. INR15]QPC94998.1 AMP-binding protein [Mesorhizobium sp. INR15]